MTNNIDAEKIIGHLSPNENVFSKSYYRTMSLGIFTILLFFTSFPAFSMGDIWSLITIIIFALAIIVSAFVIIYSISLTAKRRLILDIVISGLWIIVLSYTQFVYFSLLDNSRFWILMLLFIPNILIPVFLVILQRKQVCQGIPTKKQSRIAGLSIGCSGAIGYYIASYLFSNMGQSTAIWIIISALGIVSYLISSSFTSVFQLYILCKLQKAKYI